VCVCVCVLKCVRRRVRERFCVHVHEFGFVYACMHVSCVRMRKKRNNCVLAYAK
jgi:hypothetical protein